MHPASKACRAPPSTSTLGALGRMLVAVALLIAPAAYHRLAEAGEDTEGLHRVTTRVSEPVTCQPLAC